MRPKRQHQRQRHSLRPIATMLSSSCCLSSHPEQQQISTADTVEAIAIVDEDKDELVVVADNTDTDTTACSSGCSSGLVLANKYKCATNVIVIEDADHVVVVDVDDPPKKKKNKEKVDDNNKEEVDEKLLEEKVPTKNGYSLYRSCLPGFFTAATITPTPTPTPTRMMDEEATVNNGNSSSSNSIIANNNDREESTTTSMTTKKKKPILSHQWLTS